MVSALTRLPPELLFKTLTYLADTAIRPRIPLCRLPTKDLARFLRSSHANRATALAFFNTFDSITTLDLRTTSQASCMPCPAFDSKFWNEATFKLRSITKICIDHARLTQTKGEKLGQRLAAFLHLNTLELAALLPGVAFTGLHHLRCLNHVVLTRAESSSEETPQWDERLTQIVSALPELQSLAATNFAPSLDIVTAIPKLKTLDLTFLEALQYQVPLEVALYLETLSLFQTNEAGPFYELFTALGNCLSLKKLKLAIRTQSNSFDLEEIAALLPTGVQLIITEWQISKIQDLTTDFERFPELHTLFLEMHPTQELIETMKQMESLQNIYIYCAKEEHHGAAPVLRLERNAAQYVADEMKNCSVFYDDVRIFPTPPPPPKPPKRCSCCAIM